MVELQYGPNVDRAVPCHASRPTTQARHEPIYQYRAGLGLHLCVSRLARYCAFVPRCGSAPTIHPTLTSLVFDVSPLMGYFILFFCVFFLLFLYAYLLFYAGLFSHVSLNSSPKFLFKLLSSYSAPQSLHRVSYSQNLLLGL